MGYLVKDFLGKRGKKGDLGIEIEVEGENLPLTGILGWAAKPDGTLGAGGVEYTTTAPIEVSEKQQSIRLITDALSPKKYKIKNPCSRGSVHVHSNFLNSTPVQYWTSATAYWLTENLLFNFCDPYRKGNCFCLRLTDGEGVLKTILNDLRKDRPFSLLSTNNIRYCGQNLAATAKFGSIEYRGMSSTVDFDKINTWTSELHNLKVNVNKHYKNPSDLMDSYLKLDAKDFLESIYGVGFIREITKDKSWRDNLSENAGIISELAYTHDWDEWASKIDDILKNKGAQEIIFPEDLHADFGEIPQAARTFVNTTNGITANTITLR